MQYGLKSKGTKFLNAALAAALLGALLLPLAAPGAETPQERDARLLAALKKSPNGDMIIGAYSYQVNKTEGIAPLITSFMFCIFNEDSPEKFKQEMRKYPDIRGKSEWDKKFAKAVRRHHKANADYKAKFDAKRTLESVSRGIPAIVRIDAKGDLLMERMKASGTRPGDPKLLKESVAARAEIKKGGGSEIMAIIAANPSTGEFGVDFHGVAWLSEDEMKNLTTDIWYVDFRE